MSELVQEARRQIEICNACRYCEGYCSVFPAMMRQRSFADADIVQMANLCHNCRGCYYACQYTAPHEFDLNLPAILADIRVATWQDYAWPQGFARLFQRSGSAVALALVLASALLFWLGLNFRPATGEGFYAVMGHTLMVSIFAPTFLLPFFVLLAGLRRYWRDTGGGPVTAKMTTGALQRAAQMRDLSGGQGQGCNFEDEDRFSTSRRLAHQAVMWGFLLCFAATVSGTILHYGFALPAPYGVLSLPKLLGVPGGLLMVLGSLWLARLKLRAARHLGSASAWSGELGFVLLLAFVALSGLALWAATGTMMVPALLSLHLGSVLTLFVLTPYSKMAHGAYRFAALLRDESGRT